MRIVTIAVALLLLALIPISARDDSPPPGRVEAAVRPFREPAALTAFTSRLTADGRDSSEHGVYVETLEGGEPIAALNEDTPFNPASVMKLATSLAALDKLGPEYRFKTTFYTSGPAISSNGELDGDLILVSGEDPSFSVPDARRAGDELRQRGLRHVSGALVVVGNFNCNHNSQTDISAGVFRRHCGIPIRQSTRYETALPPGTGQPLLAVESEQLINLVQQQNAHSVNSMADLLGNHIGGAAEVRKFLVERLHLSQDSVYVSNPSGLDINRLSPRATVALVRSLVEWLKQRGYGPGAAMAVAGMEAGTLAGRFTDDEFAGSVIAKTGTLRTTDGGAAVLAGLAFTRERGTVIFAVYDMAQGRQVLRLRQRQDEFLKNLIHELGGPAAGM
jgi:D-alanyl-D-alanine carboxypeptidase/D-alanyl-D-alanine-endopeptidase (penicillin-binding protein 4)